MILATADSNIYISALQFGGVPLQFLNAARDGAFRLAISQPIIDEISFEILLAHWDLPVSDVTPASGKK